MSQYDPALPLTWPLRWNVYQAWGERDPDVGVDPFKWWVQRVMPDFSDRELLAVYRRGLCCPTARIASGVTSTIEQAKAAVEATLHQANLDLAAHRLAPRIDLSGYTAGTANTFAGMHTPTPGWAP